MRAVLHGLLDLVAPRRCAGCDAWLDPTDFEFCAPCEVLLEPAAQLDAGRAAYLYGGPIAEAIRRLKYEGRTELAEPLGARLVEVARAVAGEVDAVVPVPLHPERLRERGFNQAALLARPVARALAVPLVTSALRRVRETRPQASLGVGARGSNVRGAFGGRGTCPPRVLLIDDVRTTGATITECALSLRRRGVERVHALVLARADP